MRQLLTAAAAAALLACAGPRGPRDVAGTIGGAPFAPVEVVAFRAGPATCGAFPFGIQLSAVGLALAGFDGACTYLTSPACVMARGTSAVVLVVGKAGTSAAAAALGPGDYQVFPDVQQLLVAAVGGGAVGASHTADAACRAPARRATGKVTITAIDGSHVAGRVDVTLEGGGALKGSFDAPLCPAAPDLCSVLLAGGDVCPAGLSCR
jgi:hypothetical protein